MASVLWIPVIFLLASYGLYHVSTHFPTVGNTSTDINTNSSFKFPSNIEEIRALAQILVQYKEDHPGYVILLFSSAYLYKHTFSIPGSAFLNVLAGAIFGTGWGFGLACFLTACGATCCYLLSLFFGKAYILKHFPDRVKTVQNKVEENGDSLFFFLLFVRIFPMSPNWFFNVVSPILNIPLHYFFFSVLVGLMPYIFICVQAGSMLPHISSLDDIFSIWTSFRLVGIAVVAVIPGVIIKRIHDNRQKHISKKKTS